MADPQGGGLQWPRTRAFAARLPSSRAGAPKRGPSLGVALALTLGVALGLGTVAGTPGVAAAGIRAATTTSQGKKSLLVLADLPKGWRASKASNDNQPFPDPSALATCLHVPTNVISYTAPSVSSPQFGSRSGELTVDDQVSTYPSAAAARADFGFYTNPRTPDCFTTYLNGPGRSLFSSGVPRGDTMGSIDVSRAPATDFAPHTANLILFYPVTGEAGTFNIQLTMVDYVRGTEEQTVGLTSVESEFPASLSRLLTALAVRSL